jgi:uncharacterized protein
MLPPSEDSPLALASPGAPPEYSPEERSSLLQLAHLAISSRLERRELPQTSYSEHLSQPRGVFTTIYLQQKLRGCVGYPLALVPLYEAVIETARQAAFEDPRFYPLTQEELPGLRVSLSVLSPLLPIAPDQIEIGRHGLLISHGTRRGLLLPQVPVEHGWDRIAFLEQTCKKANLPPDAWHDAKLEAFTAEVFGDDDL